MKNNINSKNKYINKRRINGGFTLIELLATIAILSLVSVIVIYTATNVIKNAKDKSYMVTINNIEKESGTYVLENDKNIVWLSDGNYLYQCVTVQNLIDMGYFDNNILDSMVSEDRKVLASDYIYIEKDKDTKTITKQILLYDSNSELRNLCGDYINSDGVISVDVPSGWAKSKDITITYRLADSISVGDSSNYRYGYKYDSLNNSIFSISYVDGRFTTIKTVNKKITVYDEGNVYADIHKQLSGENNNLVVSVNVDVDKIDTEGPNITENISNQTVRGSVTIPIRISDSESGVDGSTISLSDFKVSIGGNVLTSGVTLTEVNHDTDGKEINYYNYNLIINNRNYAGEVVIELDKDKISDKLGNKNEAIILNTGVTFRNTYTISYDSNGGSGCSGSKTVIYNTNIGDLCIPTREGYTFIGWFDSSYKNNPLNYYADTYGDLKNAFGYNANNLWNHYLTYGKNENRRISQYVSTDIFKGEDDKIIYAGWKVHTYTIKYNANGGAGSINNITCTYDSDCKLSINTFTRTGYTYGNWNTKADGSGISYTNKQTVRNLTATDGAVINLYVQWNANSYNVNYSYNGGKKGSNAPTSGTYDSVVTIDNPSKTVTVTGNANGTGATIGSATSKAQTFAGWIYSNGSTSTAKYGTSTSTVTTSWSTSSTKVTSKYFKNLRSTSGTVTLTANWIPVAFNLPTVSKKGYICKWNTKADGSGDSYNSGASYTPTANSSSSITMYARCIINKVYINYSQKDGVVTALTKDGSTTYSWTVDNSGIIYLNKKAPYQSINYGEKLGASGLNDYNNSKYLNITRTGYAGKSGQEWVCLSDNCKGKTYSQSVVYSASDFCDASVSDCTVVLGVNWIDSQKPTPPIISLNSNGNILFNGSTDNVTSSAKLVYKGSITNSNFSANFSTPSSTSNIYAVSVDEAGNVSDVSSKKYIVDNVQNGIAKKETIITGYKCSLDNKTYNTQDEATKACVFSDTKAPDSKTNYYCKEGYTGNGSKCVKSGSVTTKYYCSNTGVYKDGSLCGTKYNQSSCSSGWSSTTNGNCRFSCGKSFAGTWSQCSGTGSCSGSFSCTATCTSAQTAAGCRGGVTIGGANCTSSKLYTCSLYGSKVYYCDLTGGYVSSADKCVDTINYSSYKTYSCPDGYSTSDSKVTKDSICTKEQSGEVTSVTRSYYSCSLFRDTEYDTENKAKTACTNYCSNSTTKYYDGKNKCIGLS